MNRVKKSFDELCLMYDSFIGSEDFDVDKANEFLEILTQKISRTTKIVVHLFVY